MARSIRPAGPKDAAAIGDLVRASCTRYVERIGKEPAPMLEDYAALIGAGEVWALIEGDEVLGVLVMRPAEDHCSWATWPSRPIIRGKTSGAS